MLRRYLAFEHNARPWPTILVITAIATPISFSMALSFALLLAINRYGSVEDAALDQGESFRLLLLSSAALIVSGGAAIVAARKARI